LASCREIPLLLPFLLAAPSNDNQDIIDRLKAHTQEHYPDRDFSRFLFVSVARQSIYHIRDWQIVSSHQVSTSRSGVGNRHHSSQTPLGLHRCPRTETKRPRSECLGMAYGSSDAWVSDVDSVSPVDRGHPGLRRRSRSCKRPPAPLTNWS